MVLDNLGDVVMATSVLKPLRSFFPEAKIGIWTKAYAKDLFENHPDVDRVHLSDPFWDTAPGHPKGSLVSFINVLKEVRTCRYDVALVLNTEWRRSLACWLAGIKERIGYRRRKSRLFLTKSFEPSFPLKHVTNDHRNLIENWMGQEDSHQVWIPYINLSNENVSHGIQWIRERKLSPYPLVLFHPFSGDKEKNWPLSYWFDLIERLNKKKRDLRFVMICTAIENAKVREAMGEFPADLCQILVVPSKNLKGVISMSSLFVGGDSGPGHLAAALGKSTLSLFGPSDPIRYIPSGEGEHQVIQRYPLADLQGDEVEKTIMELVRH
ncbi:hypothetical protein BVX98_02735 [bacterium F11]|nr:hypothetical protein BVX98_02735 [bacterium F11]